MDEPAVGDAADRKRVGAALNKKYGLIGRLTQIGSRVRRGTEGTLAILIE